MSVDAPGDGHVPKTNFLRWETLTREEVREVAPNALILIPLGATEQHGPHLPTGTDILLAESILDRAIARSASTAACPLIIARVVSIGSSDHHLPFGGTISVSPSTMLAFVTDALKSLQASGVRRVVLVNGHGGNTAVCHAAAAAVSTTTSMAVAPLDYWSFAKRYAVHAPLPGHAGQYETSLMLAIHPELVRPTEARPGVDVAASPGAGVYDPSIWARLNGYTDTPELASTAHGEDALEEVVGALSDRILDLAATM